MRSLSSSDDSELDRLVARLGELVSEVLVDGAAADVRSDTAGELLTQASRLYAARGADQYAPAVLAALRLTPTEACAVAAALLHAHSLTPFEFAVWFSSRRVGATDR